MSEYFICTANTEGRSRFELLVTFFSDNLSGRNFLWTDYKAQALFTESFVLIGCPRKKLSQKPYGRLNLQQNFNYSEILRSTFQSCYADKSSFEHNFFLFDIFNKMDKFFDTSIICSYLAPTLQTPALLGFAEKTAVFIKMQNKNKF